MVCIAVCTVADELPRSDETSSAAEGVCSIGILMCVLLVNVFIAVKELWEGFIQQSADLVSAFLVALRSSFG